MGDRWPELHYLFLRKHAPAEGLHSVVSVSVGWAVSVLWYRSPQAYPTQSGVTQRSSPGTCSVAVWGGSSDSSPMGHCAARAAARSAHTSPRQPNPWHQPVPFSPTIAAIHTKQKMQDVILAAGYINQDIAAAWWLVVVMVCVSRIPVSIVDSGVKFDHL